ncbi:coiled-coil domain-containing protein 190-like [Oncorhynchus clarkii lewisi]|uniref:coiled-coil domain-containing protein 190-like n=1 Tax=Oncorhynchus clarkii lewisi TaxID=490388 RepID=UPI0039B951E7
MYVRRCERAMRGGGGGGGGGGGRGLWQGSEAQRREEHRAQARLQGGLQRLEQATSYHLNTLTTEQRRLHRDLLNIKTGNPWRRRLHHLVSQPDSSHLSMPCRTTLPTIPRATRDPKKHRSVKAVCGGVSGLAPLQARVHDFLCSSADPQRQGAESSVAPLCLPDLKLQPAAELTSTGLGERGEREYVRGREGRATRKEEENGRTDRDREKEEYYPLPPPPSDVLAADGRPRTLHLLPDFNQSLAEARKARYIRYRGRPPCERELSITEIFARGNTGSIHRLTL